MDDSILATIKKMLGLDSDYSAFDSDIIVFINSAMMTLHQLGVGPQRGFVVSDFSQTWSQFLPSDKLLEAVKVYLHLSVKMVFDPPTSSFVMEAMSKQKEELEWRLREQVEFYPGEDDQKPIEVHTVAVGMSEDEEEMHFVEQKVELPRPKPEPKPKHRPPSDPFRNVEKPASNEVHDTLNAIAHGTVVGESLVLGGGW